MSRPSRNQDQLLIDTAKKLLPKTGISGMSLQMVAAESGVNLGMFHYFFGSKKKFVQRILESVQIDILESLASEKISGETPTEQLRSGLLLIGRVYRDHRKVITSLFQDLMNQDREVSELLVRIITKNGENLIPIIERGQANGDFEKIPIRQVMGFCMMAITGPLLMAESFDRIKKNLKGYVAGKLTSENYSDDAIELRVEMAIKGILVKQRNTSSRRSS